MSPGGLLRGLAFDDAVPLAAHRGHRMEYDDVPQHQRIEAGPRRRQVSLDDTGAHGPPTGPVKQQKCPPRKDPVVVAGAAVSSLVLICLLVFLWVDHAEEEFEGQAVRLKIEADTLARSGQSRPAYDKYEELLAMIRGKWFGSGRYHLIVASAESSRDALYPLVGAELAREKMMRYAVAEARSRWRPILPEDWLPQLAIFLVFLGKFATILLGALPRQRRRR